MFIVLCTHSFTPGASLPELTTQLISGSALRMGMLFVSVIYTYIPLSLPNKEPVILTEISTWLEWIPLEGLSRITSATGAKTTHPFFPTIIAIRTGLNKFSVPWIAISHCTYLLESLNESWSPSTLWHIQIYYRVRCTAFWVTWWVLWVSSLRRRVLIVVNTASENLFFSSPRHKWIMLVCAAGCPETQLNPYESMSFQNRRD